MNIARYILIALAFSASFNLCSQNRILLYDDNEVKIFFKPFDDKYGYIIDETYNFCSFTLVEYWTTDQIFFIKETDTIIVLDSMVFYSEGHGNYSDQVSSRFRVNEEPGMEIAMSKLFYIVNDTMTISQDMGIEDDVFHRAEIDTFKEDVELKINVGFREVGPFIIKPNDTGKPRKLDIKLSLLMTASLFDTDLKKVLPKSIILNKREYEFRAEFLE